MVVTVLSAYEYPAKAAIKRNDNVTIFEPIVAPLHLCFLIPFMLS
jgi:hypothetical protein